VVVRICHENVNSVSDSEMGRRATRFARLRRGSPGREKSVSRWVGIFASVEGENDFAEVFGSFHVSMCFGRVGDRKNRIDEGLQRAAFKRSEPTIAKTGNHGGFLVHGPRFHDGAENLEMSVDHLANIERA
jgi:hypothetical protein